MRLLHLKRYTQTSYMLFITVLKNQLIPEYLHLLYITA